MTARAFLSLYALLLLAGCSTRVSDPMSMGPGIYMMHGSTLGLMTSAKEVVTDVERHASSFCASSGGKALEVVKVETTPPESLSFTEGRLQFRCVTRAQNVAASGQ